MTSPRWSRPEKLAAITIAIAVLALSGAFVVPEVRRALSLENPKPDIAGSLPAKTYTEDETKQLPMGSAAMSAPALTHTIDVVTTKTPVTASKSERVGRDASIQTLGDEITVSDQARGLPDAVAAADDALLALRSSACTVRGHLRGTQSAPDAGLQGLITTDLILDVKLIDSQNVVQESFTLTSRGGGFSPDASALQARERLRVALHNRVQKENL